MAFIEKKDPVVLNIMLTSKGREQLSSGNLTFKYFAIGDSEVDYNFISEINADIDPDFNAFDSSILRPRDKNPNIISFIPREVSGGTSSGSPYNELSTISPISYDVINTASSIGFFTDTNNTFVVDGNHVKQPDIMIYMSGITGGNTLRLRKTPLYGTSALEPEVGDFLFVKWTLNANTTGYTVNKTTPTPYLMYRIQAKTGTLGANNLIVTVDRELPNFTGYAATGKAGALVYYSSITTSYISSTDYLTESVLDFLQNYQCGIASFPFWNMSIIFTEEIAGIHPNDRKFGQFKSRKYGGFVSYIQNQAPVLKKLGVIHYTNNSPANTYGEEFNQNTPVLDIPTIMWHKSTSRTLGLKLVASGDSKLLTGSTKSLNIEYYDLCDPLGYVVGKVFTGLKLFVIEDQELLFAMSYKSNRSWTLPNYIIGSGGSPCDTEPTPPTPPTTSTTTTTTTTTTSSTTTTSTTTIAPPPVTVHCVSFAGSGFPISSNERQFCTKQMLSVPSVSIGQCYDLSLSSCLYANNLGTGLTYSSVCIYKNDLNSESSTTVAYCCINAGNAQFTTNLNVAYGDNVYVTLDVCSNYGTAVSIGCISTVSGVSGCYIPAASCQSFTACRNVASTTSTTTTTTLPN